MLRRGGAFVLQQSGDKAAIDPGLADALGAFVRRAGVDARLLTIELTEGAAGRSLERVARSSLGDRQLSVICERAVLVADVSIATPTPSSRSRVTVRSRADTSTLNEPRRRPTSMPGAGVRSVTAADE